MTGLALVDFGDLIRAERRARRIDGDDFAAKLKCRAEDYACLEAGMHNRLSENVVARIKEEFGIVWPPQPRKQGT